jgi:mRNA interferase YafQ
MEQFQLSPNEYFKKKYKKYIQKNSAIKSKAVKAFLVLQSNPFNPSLKTHKVNAKVKNEVFSSSISDDLRIIWEFSNQQINIIDLLDIGGHSGKTGVYN